MTISEAFSLALKELRKDKGLSQERLALKADIDRKYIYLLENGKNQPTITMLYKISKALEISLAEFVDYIEKKKNRKPRLK